MVRVGMQLRCGRFVGTVWRIWRGYVFSLNSDGPLECDYRVHKITDLTVTKAGIAVAPPDMTRQRIARSWQAADP